MGEEWCEWMKPDEKEMLQSDSCLRPDLNFIKDKDYDNAQNAKDEIEEQQRKDKALRDKRGRK